MQTYQHVFEALQIPPAGEQPSAELVDLLTNEGKTSVSLNPENGTFTYETPTGNKTVEPGDWVGMTVRRTLRSWTSAEWDETFNPESATLEEGVASAVSEAVQGVDGEEAQVTPEGGVSLETLAADGWLAMPLDKALELEGEICWITQQGNVQSSFYDDFSRISVRCRGMVVLARPFRGDSL